ncbi:tRNA_anti-like [Aquimarina amphilecti]|uniref:tRNA_anti-like n=1 Tax=Aquimarina amphilecti TaxID=1038014 RepID=A0A1H7HN64_AQUAM|nr:hypothetical protein [Aquimarina amphilecti]SEK50470.1 tRNA_anti-like [Aquimarina amphilecti]
MKSKTTNAINISILLMILIGILIYIKVYNKPFANISESKPNVSIESKELIDSFFNNENEANSKFLEQIIQVRGLITEITSGKNGNNIITLGDKNAIGGVTCHLSSEESTKTNNLKIGQQINIKGICTGYLLDVILVKCVIIE